MSYFDAAFARIKEITGAKTQCEVALILKVKQSSISAAKKQNYIPANWLITLFDIAMINPTWVRYGRGSRFLIGSPPELIYDGGGRAHFQTTINNGKDGASLEQLIQNKTDTNS